MKVTIRREEGFDLAVYGMSLSFMTEGTSYEDWWTEERFNKLVNTAKANAGRDGGHNKMLESMVMWLEVRAPRFWWQEADTYRLTTKQSTGTMHTIQRRLLTVEDFEEGVGGKGSSGAGTMINELNVLDELAKLPYKERAKFYKEHEDTIAKALSKRG